MPPHLRALYRTYCAPSAVCPTSTSASSSRSAHATMSTPSPPSRAPAPQPQDPRRRPSRAPPREGHPARRQGLPAHPQPRVRPHRKASLGAAPCTSSPSLSSAPSHRPQPMLTDPSAPPPPPIIPTLPRTAPPVYPPELKRLLTVPTIKHKKPFTPAELANPRLLPARADPESPDAQLFGPLSKRREANLRKRAYDLALKRVMPPLEVAVCNDQGVSGTATQVLDAVRTEVYPRPLAMQDLGVLRDINDVIGNMISIPPPMPRRARRAAALDAAPPTSPDQISPEPTTQDHDAQSPSTPNQVPHGQASMHPFRWVRRRYRTLLASIPQLTYNVVHLPGGGVRGNFDVATPALSINHNHKGTHYNPPADAVSLAWIASKPSESPKKGNSKDSSSGLKTESKPASSEKERQDRTAGTFARKEAEPSSHSNSNSAAADKETQSNEPSG
ncbi:hypothetical protein BJ912DRAFT_1102725 [Pholiota molesta]|nr:hypothetical protein BJ912DRAFT_1102725 [Pholiota molesta]